MKRICPVCYDQTVMSDGYCGNCRECTMPPSASLEDQDLTPSSARARDLWTQAVEHEVKKRMAQYFNEEHMILRVPRSCVPEGALLAECYETTNQFIIIGTVESDDEEHNCDVMGCGTLSHVIARIPRKGTASNHTIKV